LALLPLGVLLAVAGLVLYERTIAGRGLPPFSVYSDEADGLAEAAHFLGELGWRAVALTRRVHQDRDRGLLIIAEPEGSGPLSDEGGISEDEAKGILRWVEAGNTLLLCSRQDSALHQILDVSIASDGREAGGSLVKAEPEEAGAYTDQVDRMGVHDGTTLTVRDGLTLWPVRGKGRVLVVADPTILTRRGLQSEDNAVFLANVADRAARDGVVYFDEYHHGFQSAGGAWGYIAYHGQQLLFLPLFLAVGAALWAASVRLGLAVPRPAAASADAVDYASALALLYRRAGVRKLPARTLAQGFIESLTQHLHLRRNALPAEILAAWRRHLPGASGDRLQYLLRAVSELRKGDVSGRQLLSMSRAFDEFEQQWLVVRA
jgi:hypothetical protein